MHSVPVALREIPALLRGDPTATAAWTETVSGARVATWLAVTIAGSAAFGAAMGWWREPHQALYTAAKFPLVILLTTLGNALLNAMLAPLLGVNLSLRQSLLAVLMSFTIASAILGAAAPLLAFAIWNAPPLAHAARVLRPGGKLLVLEFSKIAPPLEKAYDWYSFKVLPVLGKLVAGDDASYRYLAESIRMHPGQDELKAMMQIGGFGHVDYHNLTGGIAALHVGIKC